MSEDGKILYRYTSLEGLLGIIKDKSIRATNILYLNDASELNYSLELFKKQFLSFKSGISNFLYPAYWFVEKLMKDIDILFLSERFSFFVCSFSEENDLLSQWRGYCPKGIGFSLGFKLSYLRECARNYGYKIIKYNYDEKQLEDNLKQIIEETDQKYSDNIASMSKDSIEIELAANFYMKFFNHAPIFKHPKFKEENEWRIIAGPPQIEKVSKEIKFRSGPSMIVPYIEFPLPREEDNLIINKIVVGPTHEPILAKASVEMLLKSKNVKFDEVQYSTIPYRNW